MKPINISEKLTLIKDHWKPRIITELNNQQIRLVKILGDFPFHIHEYEDEMFFVVKGKLRIDFESHSEFINQNEILVIPAGILHRPFAEKEVHLMMFVTNKNINTGNVKHKLTINTDHLESI